MSARDYMIRNLRGSGGMDYYSEGSYLPVEAPVTVTMPRLHAGIDDMVDDRQPQAVTWDRNINRMGPYTNQSDRTPPPDI